MDPVRREALALIRSEQSLWIAKKLARNSAHLFSADTFLFKKISRGSHGDFPLWSVRCLLVAALVSYLAVLIGGILGVGLASRRERFLPLLVLIPIFGVHILLAHPMNRHRLPLMPPVIVYCAYATHRWKAVGNLSRYAQLGCGMAILAVAVWPLLYRAPDIAAL